MMKKTICVLFVFALIAQICARPDGKDDDKTKAAGDKAEEATEKGKDDADKTKGDVEKAVKDVKDKVVDAKDAVHAGDTERVTKHEKSKHNQHHKIGDAVGKGLAEGGRFIKEGSDMMACK
ncbi:uncharacterized protein [Choristoneura fumiferana]|uniref:uncharacterized protein n=1 Tax=Choristoneura fumiferana TaxID=7141 RepID=UPI003D15E829